MCRISIAVLFLCSAAVFAQAPLASGDYTKDLPSVQRVESELKGSDPDDTLARQAAMFGRLQLYIQDIKQARDYRGPYSPGEQKLLAEYAKAQNELIQSYTKTHRPAEITAFNRQIGKYQLLNAGEWIRQFQGTLAADAAQGAEAKYAQSYQRNQDRIQRGLQSQQRGSSDFSNEVGDAIAALNDSPEARRCLELGGTMAECAGTSLQSIGKIAETAAARAVGVNTHNARSVNGVVLIGSFRSRSELPGLSFGVGTATVENCGTLVADSHNYTIRKSGGATQVIVANEPDNIVLTLHPDGGLSGPGSIAVKGRVLTGYNNQYSCPVGTPIANCKSTSMPVYAPSMQRCTIRQLASVPPKPVSNSSSTGILGQLLGDTHAPLVTGIRMTGLYAGSSGLRLEFGDDAVVIDCGRAHAKVPYVVESTATRYVVHVQNGAGPFLLAVAPDNTLRGAGSTTVSGRVVTAMNGGAVNFAPHSETCTVDTLWPKGTRNTMIVSNAR